MYNIPKGDYLEIREVQSKKQGIYFLFNEEKQLLYIGQTSNIRQRLINKTSGYDDYGVCHNYKYVKYIEFEDKNSDELKQIKIKYINELKPKLNRNYINYNTEYYSDKYNKECTQEIIDVRQNFINNIYSKINI